MRRIVALLVLATLLPLSLSAQDFGATDVKPILDQARTESSRSEPVVGAPAGWLTPEQPAPIAGAKSCPEAVVPRRTSKMKETGSYPCEAIPPLQGPPPVASAARCLANPKGPLFGPFLPLVTNSARYAEGAVFPPLLRQLPPDIGNPLLNDWTVINDEKIGLEAVARPLDADDESVSTDLDRIVAWAGRLERRRQLINEEIDRYNGACQGGSLPPDQQRYCEGWRQRGNQCIAVHNAEGGRYRAYYDAWLPRRNSVENRGIAFKSKVKAWEDVKIVPFIRAATKATDDAGRTTIRIQAQGDDIPEPGGYSVAIDQLRPICLNDGLRALATVRARLNNRQFGARDQAIPMAERFMRNAAAGGGVGRSENSFQNRPADPPNARIDITVFRGLAFVDCSAAAGSPAP